jgi:Kdo2-lipid IVA lauroyltransferase/acyltransferase
MSDQRLERWSGRIGRLASRVLSSRNRIAMRNLRMAFPARPDRELKTIADDCWRHYARSILDYFRVVSEDPGAIAARIRFEGPREEFFASAARGPSLILLAHFGNWEMATYLATLVERRVTAVARKLDNPLIDRDLLLNRERGGLALLDRRRAARELLRTLERGDIVAMVVDQAVKPREGILVPFLGRPAWTTTAPARLAARCGVPIWCIHVVAEGDRIDVAIDPPIAVDPHGDSEQAIAAVTARINDQFSRRILERPELWLWMHDRWKGTPPDPAVPAVPVLERS